jgi:hypothetical protein
MRRICTAIAALVLAPVAVLGLGAEQAPVVGQDLMALLARVGAAVERYYTRAQSIMCIETVAQQSLRYDMMSDDSSLRRLTYDLRVAWEGTLDGTAPEASVQRELIKVNNRDPRPKDKPACHDPAAVSPDTLQMLLPRNQGDYVFSRAGSARVRGREALMLDYRPRTLGEVTVKAHEDREDCWSVDFPGHMRGRVWIDPESGDVLRLDEHLHGFVDIRLPPSRNRAREPLEVVFERVDSSTIFRPVSFSDPEETVLLPYSVESTTVVRNAGVPRLRETRRFTNYQRFTTGGRIVEEN